jgi:hypothetical protein
MIQLEILYGCSCTMDTSMQCRGTFAGSYFMRLVVLALFVQECLSGCCCMGGQHSTEHI